MMYFASQFQVLNLLTIKRLTHNSWRDQNLGFLSYENHCNVPQCRYSGCCCCSCCHFSRVRLCETHRRQPTRLSHLRDSPGKNTGVACHFLLQCMKVKNESEGVQSCPTLSDPMDCSPPGSSVHGIFQARILEWGAIAFSTLVAKDCINQSKKREMWQLSFYSPLVWSFEGKPGLGDVWAYVWDIGTTLWKWINQHDDANRVWLTSGLICQSHSCTAMLFMGMWMKILVLKKLPSLLFPIQSNGNLPPP